MGGVRRAALGRHPAGVFFALAGALAAALPWVWLLPVDDPGLAHVRLGIFGFGGAAVTGYILTAPTYYVLGTITEIYRRPHHMGLCPDAGKRREQFTRADWLRLAEAYPCVGDPARVRDVDVIRVRMRVDKWETPWSASQGRIGMLFRGNYLDVELKEGVVLDIDGTLLERCEKD